MAIKWSEIQYKESEDRMLDPVVTFPKQPKGNIGKYGGMRRDYLQRHRKATYARMCMEGTLKQHLIEVNEQAKTMVDQLVEQMSRSETMPDKKKDYTGMDSKDECFESSSGGSCDTRDRFQLICCTDIINGSTMLPILNLEINGLEGERYGIVFQKATY